MLLLWHWQSAAEIVQNEGSSRYKTDKQQHWIHLQSSEKPSDGATASKKPKSASNSTKVDPSRKKDKKPDVQNDPTKSEAYKSLFDTHKSAQHKGDHKGKGGFWTTFDPRYN